MRLARLGLCSFVTVIVACSTTRGSVGDGSAEVIAVTSSALTQADVAGVALTISGDGIDPRITTSLAHVGNKFQGIIGGIPAGADRTFHGEGDDATGSKLYDGDATGVTITKGTQALVALILQQQERPSPFQNSAPQITSVQASSSSVAPGDSIALQATATDPDGDALTYTWSATDGTFTNGTSPNATWTAPATEGPQTLTLRVRDPKGASAAVSFAVQVSASAGTGSASVAASFNDAPSITSISIDENPIDAVSVAHLGVTATDLDGDAIVAYEWSSTCVGAFDDNTLASPAFTVNAIDAASCAFSVKVTDARQGWNTGSLSVATGPAASVASPPIIDSTFQAGDTANGGTSLEFRAKAHDPNDPNGAVTYTWSADAGTVGIATTDATGSDVTWTAPACMSGDAHVIVEIANAAGTSTTQTFTVTPGGNSGCATPNVERADVNAAGAPGDGNSYATSLSADGNIVAFESNATNLAGIANPNGVAQVYVRNRSAKTTTLVSVTPSGGLSNPGSGYPSISADGNFIAFESGATDIVSPPSTATDAVYVRDVQGGTTIRIPADDAEEPQISADGKHVCFQTTISLVVGDNVPGSTDVYVWDLESNSATWVSQGSQSGIAISCSLSGDGSVVSFGYGLRDLWVRNLNTGSLLHALGLTNSYVFGNVMSTDGSRVAFATEEPISAADANGSPDVYVMNIATQDFWFASQGSPNGNSPALSRDGTIVAFTAGNDNSAPNIVTVDQATMTQKIVSAADGSSNSGTGQPTALSADGSVVTFLASDASLTSGGGSNVSHVIVAPAR